MHVGKYDGICTQSNLSVRIRARVPGRPLAFREAIAHCLLAVRQKKRAPTPHQRQREREGGGEGGERGLQVYGERRAQTRRKEAAQARKEV